MIVDVEIVRIQDSTGKTVAYGCPKVHWTLDDSDTIPPEQMNSMCSEIEDVVREWLGYRGGKRKGCEE